MRPRRYRCVLQLQVDLSLPDVVSAGWKEGASIGRSRPPRKTQIEGNKECTSRTGSGMKSGHMTDRLGRDVDTT